MAQADGIGVSRLGFGCAHLPGRLSRAEAVNVLETALEAGVRHFDVARMYGDGRAEGLVGELARRRRQDMVIVTKAGILPASRSAPARAWRAVARRAPSAANFVPRMLRAWAEPRFGQFSAEGVRQSLETSLRELGTDYVDALLLHECAARHVTDELKRLLERLLADGKIRAWGVASAPEASAGMVSAHPDLCAIVQVEATAAAIARPPEAKLILHSVLGVRFHQFIRNLASDPRLTARFRTETDIDPNSHGDIATLFLQEALASTPQAVVLFSSFNADHIRRNAAAAGAIDAAKVARFRKFLAP